MFDIGFWEFAALAVIALFVFGPDRLPKAAAEGARWLREIRALAMQARSQMSETLGPEVAEVAFDPKGAVRRAVVDPVREPFDAAARDVRATSESRPVGDPAPRPVIDPDAT